MPVRTDKRMGSPPRGRGKGNRCMHRPSPGRITPAWAGKRCYHQPAPRGTGDHPRVGGEKPVAMHSCMISLGSPPRGRGKAPASVHTAQQARITPAWAGKRGRRSLSMLSSWDHPRVGGEKPCTQCPAVRHIGSPPRGRGKAYRAAGHCTRLGITPAWAGKSGPHPRQRQAARDHPRVGGEKEFLQSWL